MNDKLALIITPSGAFEVRIRDGAGERQVSWSMDLAQCLSTAAMILNYPIVLPLSGATTAL